MHRFKAFSIIQTSRKKGIFQLSFFLLVGQSHMYPSKMLVNNQKTESRNCIFSNRMATKEKDFLHSQYVKCMIFNRWVLNNYLTEKCVHRWWRLVGRLLCLPTYTEKKPSRNDCILYHMCVNGLPMQLK